MRLDCSSYPKYHLVCCYFGEQIVGCVADLGDVSADPDPTTNCLLRGSDIDYDPGDYEDFGVVARSPCERLN